MGEDPRNDANGSVQYASLISCHVVSSFLGYLSPRAGWGLSHVVDGCQSIRAYCPVGLVFLVRLAMSCLVALRHVPCDGLFAGMGSDTDVRLSDPCLLDFRCSWVAGMGGWWGIGKPNHEVYSQVWGMRF